MGRRVLITGVSGYWGTELARRLERSPRGRVHRRARRAAAGRRPGAHRVHPRRHPQPADREAAAADGGGHRRPLRRAARARAGKGAGAAARHQRDRLAAAARGVREDARRCARSSCAARPRSTAPSPTRPEFFTEDMARRFPLRTRFQRDVGELESYFENFSRRYPRDDGDDAALPADAGRAHRLAADPLPAPARGADAARLRPAAAVRARRRTRSARSRRPCAGRSRGAGERRRRGQHLARPACCAWRARCRCRCRRRCSRRAVGAGGRLGLPRLPPEAVPWLRHGVTIDCTRLHGGGRLPAALDGRDGRGLRPEAARAPGGARACARPPSAPPGTARRRPRADDRARTERGAPADDATSAPRPARARARPARGAARPRRSGRAASGAERPRRRAPARAAASTAPAASRRRRDRVPGLRPAAAPRAARPAALPRSAREIAERAARRMRGDYAQDEWGYRRGVRRDRLSVLRVHVRAAGGACRRRASSTCPAHDRAMLVANHAGVLPWDATMMSVAIHKQHPLPRQPRFMVLDWAFRLPWVSAFMRRVGRRRRLALQRDAAARAGAPGDGLPRGVEGRGQALLRALPAAALRARRVRRDRAAHRRADRPGRGRRLRGDLSEARRVAPAGPADRRAVLPDHADVPARSGRWAPCRCRRSGGSSSATPIDLSGYGPEAAEDRALVFELSERCARRSRRSSTRTSCTRGSAFL